jgi:hypothetical protein
MKKRWAGLYLIFSFVVFSYIVSPVFADPLRSNNFQFQETSLGGTGLYNSQSANYQTAGTAGGILGVGNSSSSGFSINAGNITTNDPALSFGIIDSNVNFGTFSAGTTATATSAFSVIDYTSYGYVVQIIGTPPTNGTHTISAMASTATNYGTPNNYRFVSGETIASAPKSSGQTTYTISYIVNVNSLSKGGDYTSGQTLICSGTF